MCVPQVIAHTLSTVFFFFAVASPVCFIQPSGFFEPLSDEQVAAAIEDHNTYDSWNSLPLDTDSRVNIVHLYVYYFFATVAMLMGDAGSAKDARTQAFAVVILLTGNITLAIVFSKIILALQAQSAARDAYAGKMVAVNDAMQSQGVPMNLRRRVRRFFEFKYMLMAGLDDPSTSYVEEQSPPLTPHDHERTWKDPILIPHTTRW